MAVITQNYARQEINRGFWRHPITIMMVIFLLYFAFEGINPNMYSKLGWFNYLRKFISFFAFFYITYSLLNNKKHVRFFIRFWIFLSFFLALYSVKQHILGFADWEMTWIRGDDLRYQLYFQHGLMRKFSILSDPAAAGALFSSMAVFTLIIALRTHEKKNRWWLILFAIVNVLAFSYSGTRTANLMLIAGIFFYCIATLYEKKTIMFFAASVVAFIMVLTVPINNPVLFRIRTTFQGSKDPSAALRNINRASIQPYIWTHPIGGGINTCGIEGALYNPGHRLSSFHPDSGYMKTAVEQGPIGLVLLLIFYYLIMRTGIRNFYSARDPETKKWLIAILCMIFSLFAGQYAQMVIGQYPTVYFFYAALVILIKLNLFENNSPEQQKQQHSYNEISN